MQQPLCFLLSKGITLTELCNFLKPASPCVSRITCSSRARCWYFRFYKTGEYKAGVITIGVRFKPYFVEIGQVVLQLQTVASRTHNSTFSLAKWTWKGLKAWPWLCWLQLSRQQALARPGNWFNRQTCVVTDYAERSLFHVKVFALRSVLFAHETSNWRSTLNYSTRFSTVWIGRQVIRLKYENTWTPEFHHCGSSCVWTAVTSAGRRGPLFRKNWVRISDEAKAVLI
jgi:hypothetical protein